VVTGGRGRDQYSTLFSCLGMGFLTQPAHPKYSRIVKPLHKTAVLGVVPVGAEELLEYLSVGEVSQVHLPSSEVASKAVGLAVSDNE